MLSVAGEFVAIGRALVQHQQRIAGLRPQRPREHMHFRPHRLLDPWTPLQPWSSKPFTMSAQAVDPAGVRSMSQLVWGYKRGQMVALMIHLGDKLVSHLHPPGPLLRPGR